MHNWQQMGTCLNGPNVWQCKACGEWTRSFGQPAFDAQLIDPDTGEKYSARKSSCSAEVQLQREILTELQQMRKA